MAQIMHIQLSQKAHQQGHSNPLIKNKSALAPNYKTGKLVKIRNFQALFEDTENLAPSNEAQHNSVTETLMKSSHECSFSKNSSIAQSLCEVDMDQQSMSMHS
jgi:hypothetical protein